MKGNIHLKIKSNKLDYDFTVKRNITFISDNSGKGKSQLIKLIDNYNSGASPVKVITSGNIKIKSIPKGLDLETLKIFIKNNKNTILISDEDLNFTHKEIANFVMHTDNYFIFINRTPISELPYSMYEIYKIATTLKNKVTYNNLIQTFDYFNKTPNLKCDLVITEDKKSGNQFMKILFGENNILVKSADGKDNLPKNILEYQDKNILVILDSSAFGSTIGYYKNSIELAKLNNCNIITLTPESFEYLLLKCLLEINKNIKKDLIENTSDYADSCNYFSWERYYTQLLKDLMQEHYGLNYSKSNLIKFFKTSNFIQVFRSLISDDINWDLYNTNHISLVQDIKDLKLF